MRKIFDFLDSVFTTIKIICIIVLLCLIAVLALQRFTKNEKAIAGYRVFNVQTESMIPKYQVGDILIVKETAEEDLRIGDDVTYLGSQGSFNGRTVTHRLMKVDETEEGKVYHTKGIANDSEDPTITYDQIYGIVVYKAFLFSEFSKLMNNMTAFYIVFFVPLGILVFLQIKDKFAVEYDKDDEDDDEEDDDDDDEDDNDEK